MIEKPTRGIAVDGSCLGNPGIMQYQGIDIETGERLFYNRIPLGTNNIAEYLAIIHAFMYCKKKMKGCASGRTRAVSSALTN